MQYRPKQIRFIHPSSPAGGCGPGFSRIPGPIFGSLDSSPLPHPGSPAARHNDWQASPSRVNPSASASVDVQEIKMLEMLSNSGGVERGLLLRRLKGKYVIRGEAAADAGAGDFFNGPFNSLEEARRAAEQLSSSETAFRRGNAIPRMWTDAKGRVVQPEGGGAKAEVVRIYEITHEAPGIQSVAASQRESGKVMARPAHYEAIRQGKPEIAHEYPGGNNQLELPVKGMREKYNVNIVRRVSGAEYRIKPDGTAF
jgi:hypothetical protein